MRLLLCVSIALIFAFGLVMVYNTSSAEILDRSLPYHLHQVLVRQLAYAVVGLFLAYFVIKVGYRHLIRLSPYLLLMCTFFLILVFVPNIGLARNGSHRWIAIGNFTFQPSELVKLLLPMTFIEWILRQQKPVTFFQFVKCLLFLGIPLVLVLKEPDNGASAIIACSLLPLFFVAGIPLRFWALPFAIILVVGSVFAYQLPYVRSRIDVYLHPEKDLMGKGHQAYQAKIACGSGGVIGKGPGGSVQKLTYLPESQNDYIAAIYAEEFGFVGMVTLIALYMLMAYAGFAIALKCPDPAGCYLAALITFLIALQAFLNLGVVSGLLPSKGVNLPFFSGGGTSLVTNILALAILLNVGSCVDAQKSHT